MSCDMSLDSLCNVLAFSRLLSFLHHTPGCFFIIIMMETTASKTGSSEYPPMRILVQTVTHLVPGNSDIEKCDFIFNASASTTGIATLIPGYTAGLHTMIYLPSPIDAASS